MYVSKDQEDEESVSTWRVSTPKQPSGQSPVWLDVLTSLGMTRGVAFSLHI